MFIIPRMSQHKFDENQMFRILDFRNNSEFVSANVENRQFIVNINVIETVSDI